MRRTSFHTLSGQSVVMFALTLPIIILMLGLVVDASGAWWVKQGQIDEIEVAKEAVLNRSNEIKFSADGSKTSANIAKESLETNVSDIEGAEYTITCYELPQSETTVKNRLIGVEIEINQKYETVFARSFGFKTLGIKSRICFTINPYSSTTVWRPSENENGIQLAKAMGAKKGEAITKTGLTRASIPIELETVIEDGLKDLN